MASRRLLAYVVAGLVPAIHVPLDSNALIPPLAFSKPPAIGHAKNALVVGRDKHDRDGDCKWQGRTDHGKGRFAMSAAEFIVHGRWDDESRSWWTDGEDVPGLCVQAGSFDELVELVFSLAPELLVANDIVSVDSGTIALTVIAERHGTARLVA